MAKGNMLLGYSRGSVGDVVMSRVKGQQVSKARNRKPANPKTKRQMAQRSSFISPVKFYTHGVQALFKFAFSDKKVTESDFNAFMRNNSKAAFPVTKAEFDNPSFPALGNYMMTKGKLAEIPTEKESQYRNANFINLGTGDAITTIAQLSAAFVAKGYADEGDIITIVRINEQYSSTIQGELSFPAGEFPHWQISQFIVDSSDPTTVASAMPDVVIVQIENERFLETTGYNEDELTNIHATAYIRSKETALGLEVSTSYIKTNEVITELIAFRNLKPQVDKVLASWGATDEAILQGSIAKK